MKSLQAQQHALSTSAAQIEYLSSGKKPLSFTQSLKTHGLFPLKPLALEIFQMNIGKQCNQTCKHCHVDAGPDRKEKMSIEILNACLNAIKNGPFTTVDITGGAPEMHPDFRWFVEQCSALGKKIIVRCNLTIVVANKKYHDLPEFYRKHKVEVVSSLPFYTAGRTDSQRGDGVFKNSITALQMLNAVGYGIAGSGLVLNLVYNPAGAFLPGSQEELKKQFKNRLRTDHKIEFNDLFAITNLPVSRFLDYLITSGNYESYMDKLIQAFNPVAAQKVMCRNTVSVSWDGFLYDCDFNQMLDMKINNGSHITTIDVESLTKRNIILNEHCYGCTAGAGSSCGGTTT